MVNDVRNEAPVPENGDQAPRLPDDIRRREWALAEKDAREYVMRHGMARSPLMELLAHRE